MQFVFGWIILILSLSQNSVDCKTTFRQFGTYFLEETELWSKCSTTCGEGVQEKLKACFVKTYYILENVQLEKCNHISSTKTTNRVCNYGDCADGYAWKAFEWSKCSHTCGYQGVQMRDIECFNTNGQAADPEMCIETKKPKVLRSCNRYNCPPEFLTKQWGPCIRSNECSSGRQRRELSCISLLSNGTVIEHPRAACNLKGLIPPSSWKICDDHIDSNKCSKKSEVIPEIISERRTIIQMKRIKKIHLQVGYISYIIPGTTVSMICPVKNFLPLNIVWFHKNDEYRYKGKSNQRLRVTRKGKMILKTFLIQDQGEWICKAGNVTDKIVIKPKSPSDGFKDWAIRNALWNDESESIQLDMMQKEVIRWITGPWSQCSTSCDDIGFQSRMVQCENLQRHSYEILDDDECRKKFGEKPVYQRTCDRTFPCPEWILTDQNENQCTDRCIDYEKALLEGDLKCMFKNQSVEFDKCDSNNKPIVECDNSICRPKWKISPWTKCSRSCGQMGIQARFLICIWDKSELPAGNVCYKMNLEIPKVIKSCQPPKCNLKCIDMQSNCKQRASYCRIAIYNFRCCKTCRGYFSKMLNRNS